MSNGETNVKEVDCVGKTCPQPLVETRKAIRKASPGDIIEVSGDHPASKEEIPMAVEELGMKLLEVDQDGDVWKIRIKVTGGED